MKKIINWIMDQQLESLDDYQSLVIPMSEEFDLVIACAQALVDTVIEWERDSNTIESLEELLLKTFPDIVTN